MLFRVGDYSGISVILSKRTWGEKLLDPVYGHPEVKPLLPFIKTTIQSPEQVFQSIRDPRSKLICRKITSGSYASYFLVVVVKYVKEDASVIGYVSTVMINRKLPRTSKLIWQKNRSI